MKDILEGLYNTDDEKGKQKAAWCSFFFYLFLLLSFVISIVASVKCTKDYLNKTLFTYKFPLFSEEMDIPAGVPVSLDWRGYVQRGAGFGIYRNTSFSQSTELEGLKTEVMCHGRVLVGAYTGNLVIYTIEGEDSELTQTVQLPLSTRYEKIKIDHFIKLSEYRAVVVGNDEMIPTTVTVDATGTIVEVEFGTQHFVLEDLDNTYYPHADRLDNETIGFIFERNYQIWAGTATWSGWGSNATLTSNNMAIANEDCIYEYHGVAGMSSDKFIIAATGRRNNGTIDEHSPGDLRAKVVTVGNDGTLSFGEWSTRWYTNNSNWFALDNFNEYNALACYYDGFEGNGVVAINLFLSRDRNTVEFGGYTMVENGGAAVDEQKIAMRILSDQRFGVFFPDASANGNLIFMMGERTTTNELTRIGSNFVIARKSRAAREGNFYFSIASIDSGRFTLLDSFTGEYSQGVTRKYSSLNIGYHYAYPVGITTNRGGKDKYIQFNGVYTFTDGAVTLRPGYTYYTNSKGELVRGRAYGYNHAEYGTFYVDAGTELLALHNQIGIAVSETELLIRTY